MVAVWKRVFSNWKLSILALGVAWAVFSFSVWVSNFTLILTIFNSSASLSSKVVFLFSLYGTISTNFSPVSAVATILIAFLVGLNLSLLVYYIRARRVSGKNKVGHSLGILGFISGLFGIGCAACGSVIITGLFSSFGGFAFLALLPLHGAEFSVFGLALLLYSIVELTKRISDPLVCPVV